MTSASLVVQKIITSLPKAMNSHAQYEAWGLLRDFADAMQSMMEAEDELAGEDQTDRAYWLSERREALGKSAEAASNMPALWLQILGVEVTALSVKGE